MLTKRYLNQLNVNENNISTLSTKEKIDYVASIYFSHLKTFPFHNFELQEISRQHPVQRNKLTLFTGWHKGINGGFCFQSAQLLYQVLNDLGFEVTRCLARVLIGSYVNSEKILSLPATHLILTVSIDQQKYLLDPSLASLAPRSPVLIRNDDAIVTQGLHRFYSIDGVYVLEKQRGNQWIQLIQTDLQPATEKQIQFSLLKLERFPKKLEIRDHKLVVGIVTDTGSKSLYWNSSTRKFLYTNEDRDQITEDIIPDAEKVNKLLKSAFNIKHISIPALEKYFSVQVMPTPKGPWEIDFPLDKGELIKMSRNLKSK